MRKIAALLLLSAFFSLPARAELNWNWVVDSNHSKIRFQGQQGAESFTGGFSGFSAQIHFNPHDLDHSFVTVDIPTRSVSTGSGTRDGELPKTEWFDFFHFPTAKFTASKFVPVAGYANTYDAWGFVTIKEITRPCYLRFQLSYEDILEPPRRDGRPPVIVAQKARMNGVASIDRFAHNIGTKTDEATVGRFVKVMVVLNAERKVGEED